MRPEKCSVVPVESSLSSELLFELEILIDKNHEIPIEIKGCLYSEDNKKISNIYESYGGRNSLQLAARDPSVRFEEERINIKLIADLNSKALEHIETIRTKSPRGDVKLTLDLFMRTLISKAITSHMFLVDAKRLNIDLGEGYRNPSAVFYEYKRDFSADKTDMWLLSGEGQPAFIEVRDNNFKMDINIASSDWIHDFCPIFQIGKFSIFEYLLPAYIVGSGSLEERLNEAINAIKKMEGKILEGEWDEVIDESRPICELLRNEKEIKDLMVRDGYNEQAFMDLNGSIKNLFNFSSKFIHRLDKDKKIMPEIKASKEDAYLIYSLCINLVNLISKKMQRLSP